MRSDLYGMFYPLSDDRRLEWAGIVGKPELMLVRVPDPGNLAAVRQVYDQLAEENCALAYVFVNQRGDGLNTWDVFQLSPISYLAHCNRLSGPGAGCNA